MNDKPVYYTCFMCGGDGKATCSNPDHGFLGLLNSAGMSANESQCPCCGWDENHKIKNGGPCECCSGNGYMTLEVWEKWADEYYYDDEPIEHLNK